MKELKINTVNKLILISIVSLIVFIGIRKFQKYKHEMVIEKYTQIKNWQNAKDLFEQDSTNKDLKYFFFGLDYNYDFDSIKEKHDLDVIFMGDLIHANLNMYNHFVETQIIKNSAWGNQHMTKADSVWTNFVIALETRQIEYLISNSLESIKCAELAIDESNENEQYEAKFIFENHIDKLMHLRVLSTQRRSIYENDNIIRVSYTIQCKQAEEGAYDLIFLFDKIKDKFLFSGMIMT